MEKKEILTRTSWAGCAALVLVGFGCQQQQAYVANIQPTPDIVHPMPILETRPIECANPDVYPIVIRQGRLPDAMRFHTVKRGETLMAIARGYYGDQAQSRWRDIARANDLLDNPSHIHIGQELHIPH